MSDRAAALAAEFESANTAVIEAVETTSDDDWKQVCSGEGWSVGVTARHIAVSHQGIAGLVKMVANDQPLPPGVLDSIDAGNAQHAKEHADCSRDEVLEILRRGGQEAAELVRGLTDEQLDRTQPMQFAGGAPLSTAQIIEMVLIGHPKDHLNSIQAARSA